jgi:general secretion pathway protein D
MTKPSHIKFYSLLGVLAIAPVFPGTLLHAQESASSSVESAADREIARRQEKMSAAQGMINAGNKASQAKDYETAVAQYRSAVDALPESPVTHNLRATALNDFSTASVRLAEQRISEGRYNEAENVIKVVLEPQYNPNYVPAVSLMAKLESPDYYNKTITPRFIEKVTDVKKLFVDANGFYETAQYDMAYKRCEQILNIDPYNIAARRMEEKINLAKSKYAQEGYNTTRGYMVWQVEKAWDRPVKKYGIKGGSIIEQAKTDVRGTERISNLLNSIIIPKIEFHEATVAEAINFLKQKSKELDPNHQGVNIVLKADGAPSSAAPAAPEAGASPTVPGATPDVAAATPSAGAADTRITLSLSNIPLFEALRYITSLANLKVKIDPYAVAIVPITENTDQLLTKEYNVPPGFISNTPSASGGSDLSAPAIGKSSGGGADITKGGTGIATRANAKQYLADNGVTFPEGASANYLAASSRLIVRNTQANLDLIDTLVDAAIGQAPRQVEIEAKFVEIQQNNLKELSFTWALGAPPIKTGPNGNLAIGGGDTAVGGTNGNITTYNRTGGLAIGANAIDALLFPTSGLVGALAPAASISGVLSGAQYSVLIQAMNQKKGIDLLSAPRVTTKSGQRATIEVIREFRYPTEFQPPQIPTTVGGGNSSGGLGSTSIAIIPITPTTPTGFETRNTGVTLEVEPQVGPDGYTIDLNLVPQVVEFEGFINYGSPINTINPGVFSGITGASTITLTENTINQPIFSTRKVTTSVTVWDGQTVVLGGLMREDVQKTQDKVPFLGDIPLLGRLFRSDVDQHIKRNLVIFVTARLINPAGSPLQDEEEKEEVVEPLTGPETIAPQSLPEAPVFVK